VGLFPIIDIDDTSISGVSLIISNDYLHLSTVTLRTLLTILTLLSRV